MFERQTNKHIFLKKCPYASFNNLLHSQVSKFCCILKSKFFLRKIHFFSFFLKKKNTTPNHTHFPSKKKMPSFIAITSQKNKETTISQGTLFKSKEWLYGIVERLGLPNDDARDLAFLSILVFENLLLRASGRRCFSVPLNTHYLQLFGLVSINTAAQSMPARIASKAPADRMMSFGRDVYSSSDFASLQTEVNELDFIATLALHKTLDHLEVFLREFPQETQIRNVSLILLDAYHLQFIVLLSDARKVALAVLAVARFWVMESVVERWLPEYETFTQLSFHQIKEQYDQVYCLAYAINQRNLAKKREEKGKRVT